mmetsp:Transcript_126603/g.405309  ORF Transcript_126603/g.405309 Transcript_126603/m.405309 type:complete len:278 (+) Transcript_126603:929-1762(+)
MPAGDSPLVRLANFILAPLRNRVPVDLAIVSIRVGPCNVVLASRRDRGRRLQWSPEGGRPASRAIDAPLCGIHAAPTTVPLIPEHLRAPPGAPAPAQVQAAIAGAAVRTRGCHARRGAHEDRCCAGLDTPARGAIQAAGGNILAAGAAVADIPEDPGAAGRARAAHKLEPAVPGAAGPAHLSPATGWARRAPAAGAATRGAGRRRIREVRLRVGPRWRRRLGAFATRHPAQVLAQLLPGGGLHLAHVPLGDLGTIHAADHHARVAAHRGAAHLGAAR